MTAYDLERLHSALSTLNHAETTTAKGGNLQNLAEYLLGLIPGAEITGSNSLDHARSDEKDLWLTHTGHCGLPFADLSIPVECKNKKRRTSASEIRDFGSKIRNSGGSDGILVTRAGLSGKPGKSAHHAIGLELAQRIRITVITVADLAKLTDTTDLVLLLNDRLYELRVNQTYLSI